MFKLKAFVVTLFCFSSMASANLGQSLGQEMKIQANKVLASFGTGLANRAVFDLNSVEEKTWRYYPEPNVSIYIARHPGVSMGELTPQQELEVMKLLDTVLSESGRSLVDVARAADSDPNIQRSFLYKMLFLYGKENYFISFYKSPSSKLWKWRFQGHHISVNVTLDGDRIVSASPLSIGANPSAYTLNGKHIIIHRDIIDNMRWLNSSLSKEQLMQAGRSLKAVPKDLLYTPSLKGKSKLPRSGGLPKGLSFNDMTEEQKEYLTNMILSYWSYTHPEIARLVASKVNERSGLGEVEYIFKSGEDFISTFYFRIQGPTFVFEFGNGDGELNHYHVAWQDLN